MSDVSISYKDTTIAEMSASGTKTLLTEGKYCEDDFTITYTKPSVEEVEEKDINFYDYDGTLVESWSLDELQSKTELPANPSHDGLTAQGWNWTLATLKADNKPVQVGQNYTTDDGKTRLYLYFESGLPLSTREVELSIYQSVANGVEIDWGDGSATETLSGTGSVYTTHTYQDSGNYTLTLLPSDNCTLGLGQRSSYNVVSKYANNYSNFLIKVELGKNLSVTYSSNAFRNCNNLRTISVPSDFIGFAAHLCNACRSLICYIWPNANAIIYDGNFLNCNSLKVFSLGEAQRNVGYSMFNGCYNLSKLSLHKITIFTVTGSNIWQDYVIQTIDLSSVETIVKNIEYLSGLVKATFGANIVSFDTSLLRYSPLLQEVHFKATTPVPITISTAFQQAPTTCKFYVPTGTLSAYTSATNYPDPSVYTYVEE